jgi:hypothetical protein
MRSYVSASAMTVALILGASALVEAQQPPPIDGVTGTVALEGTVQETYQGVNAVLVKAVDGIEHLFHLTGRTVVHGGAAAGDDVLRALDAGSRVVVYDTAEGEDEVAGDGLKTIEGVVTHVDRRAKTMSIRLADGSQQTLRLTDRVAAGRAIDGAAADAAKVVVYVNDEMGRPVAHYFRRLS